MKIFKWDLVFELLQNVQGFKRDLGDMNEVLGKKTSLVTIDNVE